MSVVWIVGLPGSGKSTLAEALRRVVSSAASAVVLDGEPFRAALGDGTEPAVTDRLADAARLARVARLLSSQRLVVIATDVCSDPARLAWNRANLPGYHEIVLTASQPILQRRDVHGVYARARAAAARGEAPEGYEWNPPASPDLVIAMDSPEPPEVLALRVAMLIPEYVAAATAVARTPPGRIWPPVRIR